MWTGRHSESLPGPLEAAQIHVIFWYVAWVINWITRQKHTGHQAQHNLHRYLASLFSPSFLRAEYFFPSLLRESSISKYLHCRTPSSTLQSKFQVVQLGTGDKKCSMHSIFVLICKNKKVQYIFSSTGAWFERNYLFTRKLHLINICQLSGKSRFSKGKSIWQMLEEFIFTFISIISIQHCTLLYLPEITSYITKIKSHAISIACSQVTHYLYVVQKGWKLKQPLDCGSAKSLFQVNLIPSSRQESEFTLAFLNHSSLRGQLSSWTCELSPLKQVVSTTDHC